MPTPIISGDVTTIISGGGLVLMGVVGYFLKKTHQKIDETSAAVVQLNKTFTDRIEEVDHCFTEKIDRLEIKLEVETKATRSEIVQIFQDICHERQDACGKLRDAKLEAVDNGNKAICHKLQALVVDRERRWEKQESLNERVREHIYHVKDGGRSWDLKKE